MTDTISAERRSSNMARITNMARIKSTDTAPELKVRRLVHALGYRYRLHRKDLPGKPDLVFTSRRKIIFVHGCFWHAHTCVDGRPPRSNSAYWVPKLARNKERDALNAAQLATSGWDVMTVWECETKDLNALRNRVLRFLA